MLTQRQKLRSHLSICLFDDDVAVPSSKNKVYGEETLLGLLANNVTAKPALRQLDYTPSLQPDLQRSLFLTRTKLLKVLFGKIQSCRASPPKSWRT